MRKRKSFWERQKTLFIVILCFLLTFVSLGISSLVSDVVLVADADEVSDEMNPAEEELRDEDELIEEEKETEEETKEEEGIEEEAQKQDVQSQIGTFASSVDVSSWDQLSSAMRDTNVSVINLTGKITRTGNKNNDLPEISRNLVINGNGNTIDFQSDDDSAFILSRVSNLTNLGLVGIKIDNLGCEYLVRHADNSASDSGNSATSTNWNVAIKDLTHEGTTTTKSIFKATGSAITLSGNIEWHSTSNVHETGSNSTSGLIVAKDFTITDEANVNITARRVIFNARPYNAQSMITMRIDKKSKVTLHSKEEATIWLGKQGQGNRIHVDITGAGTEVKASSNGMGVGNSNAVLSFAGTAASGDDAETDDASSEPIRESYVAISDGAILDVDSKGDGTEAFPGVISQIEGGEFRVSGKGTKMNIKTLGGSDTYGAAFRLRLVGYQRFDVSDQAEVNIRKVGTKSEAPAMRFYGKSNEFHVRSGGKIKVYNKGSQSPKDPGGNGRNQGIQYKSGGSSGQIFDVSGYGSAIEIVSDYGAAVDIDGKGEAQITLADRATFIARGRTKNEDHAIFNVRKVVFVNDNPLYYDFANTRYDDDPNGKSGGLVFDVNDQSTYTSTNSDLAVWKKTSSIHGNPYRSWTVLDFKLNNADFTKILSTNYPAEFNTQTFGSLGMKAYSRISGNNASPIIDELRVPTNADKYVYGHAGVPEGIDWGIRDAWTDEVYVTLLETLPDGTSREVVARSVGMGDGHNGVSIYGEPARGGIFVFDVGHFIQTGTTYKVLRAWRGTEDPDSGRTHESLPTDITTGVVTTIDKTPPLPVKVNNTLYANGNYIEGTWQLDGVHNDDPPVRLAVTLNGTKLSNEGVINADGTWKYTFPSNVTLKANDNVQIFLEDANGNINPASATKYHDAIFPQATKIVVKAELYRITANDVILGYDAAKLVLNDSDYIRLANAKGIKTSDSSSVPVKVKDNGGFKAEEGIYTVTFCIDGDEGVTKKVTFEVLPYDVVIPTDEYIIAANHIEITRGEAKKIQDDPAYAKTKLKELTGAIGWIRQTRQETAVSLDSHNVKDEVDLYKATFKIDAAPTVKATVNVNVTKGQVPLLNVEPAFISIPLNGSFEYMHGVSASDAEDGDLTNKVLYTGIVNTSKKGMYILEYSVTDSDFNTVTKRRIVAVGLHVGKEYAYDVHNYVILKDDVKGTNAEILNKTEARAWSIATGLELAQSDLMVKENGGYKAEVNDYTVIIKAKAATDPADEVSAIAKVVDNDVIEEGDKYTIVANNIVLTLDQAKAIANNDELVGLAKAKAWKLSDLSEATVVLESTNFTAASATAKDYTATFQVNEDKATKVTIKIKVIDKDVIEHGDKYTIGANNIVMTLDEAKAIKNHNELINLAKAEAFKRKDMSAGTVKLESTTFEAKVNDYTATFSVEEEPATKVTVQIKVIDKDIIEHGDKYTIGANNIVMTLDEAKTIKNHNELINLAKAEAFKRKDMSVGTVKLESTTFEAKVNDYTATFSVEEEPATKVTVQIKVIDRHVIEHGDTYTIGANNIVMNVAQANAMANNDELIGLAKAVAVNRKDMSAGTVELESTDFERTATVEKDYTATFRVKEEPATKATITIKVVKKDEITSEDHYAIGANNFTITKSKAENHTEENLIEWGAAEGWKVKDLSNEPVKVKEKSIGTDVTSQDYYVIYQLVNHPEKTVKVKVTVTNGEAPELTVDPEFMSIEIDAAFDYKQGVSAWDSEDGDLTGKVISTGSVDTSKKGVYVIEYSVTDNDGNTANKKRIVAVGLYVGKDYIYDIHNYVILKDDVTGTDKEILDNTEATAWLKATGQKLNQTDLMVKDNGGYKAVVDEYRVVVKAKAATDAADEVAAIAKVVEGDVIERGDNYTIVASNIVMTLDEAKAITDNNQLVGIAKAKAWKVADLTEGTVKLESTTFEAKVNDYTATFSVEEEPATKVTVQIKVIDRHVIEHGDTYTIGANNIVMNVAQANAMANNDELIGLAKAVAVNRKDMSAGTVELESTDFERTATVEKDYTATFRVKEEPATKATITIKVIDRHVIEHGDTYTIAANNIIIKLEDAAKIVDNNDFINLTKAVAINRKDMSAGTVKLDSTDFDALTVTAKDYTATFSVEEEQATKVTVKIKVVDKDELTTTDDYAIGANDFVITRSKAENHTNADLIKWADAQGWNVKDFSDEEVEVAKKNIGTDISSDEYYVTFQLKNDPDTKVTVKVTISKGDEPELIVDPPVMSLQINDTYDYKYGVSAWDEEDKDLTDKVVSFGTVDTSKKGVYVVTYSVTDSDHNTVEKDRVVAVGLYVGEDYIYDANNFVILEDDVDGSDEQILDLTDAKAWDKETGKPVDADKIIVSDNGGYSSQPDDYVVKIKVDDATDPSDEVEATAKVVEGDVIERGDGAYTIVASNIVMTVDQAKVMTSNDELVGLAKAKAWMIQDLSESKVNLEVTDFKKEKGNYTATFNVDEQRATKVTVKIKVVDKDVIEHGDKYTIAANNIIMSLDEAKLVTDNNKLVDLAKAEAFKRKDMSAGTVKLESTTFEAKVNDYTATFSVEEEPATKVTVQIKVIDRHIVEHGDTYTIGANNIIMNVKQAKEISSNDELVGLAKAVAISRKDMSAGTVKLESTDFVAASVMAKDYTATFHVEEEPATKVTITIKVVDKDELTNNDDYAIGANDFTITRGKADDPTDADLIKWADAEGWNVKDFSDEEVIVLEKNIGTDVNGNDYYVIYALKDHPETTVKVSVTVETGKEPILTVDPAFMELEIGDTYNYKHGISAWDDEDKDITEKVISIGTVDTSKKGVYVVTYSVTDSDGNTVSKNRVVAVGLYVGENYIYDAHNFVILEDDVDGTDAQILDLTEAKAWDKATGQPIDADRIVVADNGGYKAEPDEYEVKIKVDDATDPSDQVTAIAKVVEGNVIEHGDKYTIVASNIVMTLDEAKTITDNNQLVDLMNVKAWKLKDLTEGTVKLESTDFKAEVNDYTATFYVDEEKDTKVTARIKVVKNDIIEHGDKYTISADNILMTLDEANLLTDNDELIDLAHAQAFERKDMSAGTVTLDSTTFEKAKGDYVATFSVVEEPATKVTIAIKVMDKDVIEHGDKYTIAANNLVLTLNEANALTSNDELIVLSDAEAYNRKDMTPGTVLLESTSFKKAKGDYTATFYVKEEPATKATISIKVLDKDVIEHGDKYTIAANNLVLTLDEANLIVENSELIGLAKAEAYNRKDMSAGTVKLDSTNFNKSAGDYIATFSVEEEPATKVTIAIKVLDIDVIEHGDTYTIAANNLVMNVEQAKTITNHEELVTLAKAEAYNRKDMSQGTVLLDVTNFKAEAGNYTATFYVAEEPATKATIAIKVVDKDVITTEDNYAIGANNITIDTQVASTITNDQLILLADAEGWRLRDLALVAVEVEDHNIEGKLGTYTATFRVVQDPSIKVTISVNVVKVDMTIHANDFTIPYKDAAGLTKERSVELSGADIVVNASNKDEYPTVAAIEVHEPHLKTVNASPTEGGVYDMKLKVDHLGIEYATLIKVTVLPEELPSIAIPSETPTTSNPSTGDTTSTAGLVGLGMISLLGVLVLVKRKKEEE